MIRKHFKLSVAALALTLTLACSGLITSLRVGLAASRPFVQSLVTSKVISQDKADVVVTDVGDGIDAVVVCDAQIKAIPKSLSKAERRVQKALAYERLANSLRDILKRHNIGGNEQLDRIAGVVQGFIEALDEYVRSVSGGSVAASSASSAGADAGAKAHDADKDLEKAMDQKMKELKEATKLPKQ